MALAAMSIMTARLAPMRSSKAPASGLTAMPGVIAANPTQPAKAGDWKRLSTKSTIASKNMRAARRDAQAATKSAGRPGSPSNAL
jgi:hypothetical protein